MRPASIKDVARLANVSPATVSRALNAPVRLEADTLARVQSAIAALGYVPDGVARSLRTQRTQTVGMCIPNLQFSMFSETVETVQVELNRAGFTLLLAVTGYDADLELAELSAMVQRGIDGIVLVGGQHHPQLFAMLRTRRIPYVIVWSFHADHPSVGFDHRRAMVGVTTHLLECGHERIAAVMSSVQQNDRVRDRLAGIRDALSARGLTLPDSYQISISTGLRAGREAMAHLLDLPRPPTAVACGNDVIAIGALMECRARGLDVPRDMSITGFCEMEIGQMQSPMLTTVRTPIATMGRKAAHYLVDRMQRDVPEIHEEIPTELLIRESSGLAPRGNLGAGPTAR